MATIRLVPSTYYLSNTSYLSISNAENMYNNTDNTTYATVTNSQTGTSSYYIYIRGFNFDDVPDGVIINSYTVKFKAKESGVSTSTSYRPMMASGTSTYSAMTSSGTVGTSASTITFSGTTLFETIKSAGSNFGIRINCRRASRNTTGYMYLYGAEIEVDYTVPVSATVTSTLSGNGTISPSGAYATYEDAEYTLTITPDDTSEAVTATKNGSDITSSLVAHYPDTSASTVLGTYTLKSGGFNGSGATYFSGIVGNGVNATQTTSNYYSSSSSTNAVFTYAMNFNLPSGATVTRVYCEVNGHAESTSQSSEYMCVQLKSGSTELSSQYNFKSAGTTSNSTQTLEATTLPTVSQLQSMVLECTLGYYGGAINGATCYVEYTTESSGPEYYTYTYTVDGDATISVVIGSSSGNTDVMYIKVSGSWVAASKIYKKVSGSWVEQTDLTNVFTSGVNYVKG